MWRGRCVNTFKAHISCWINVATAVGMLLHQLSSPEEVMVYRCYIHHQSAAFTCWFLCQFSTSCSSTHTCWTCVQVLACSRVQHVLAGVASGPESVLPTAGEMVTKQPLIRSMRTVKRETLKLISGWVSRSNDPQMVRRLTLVETANCVLIDELLFCSVSRFSLVCNNVRTHDWTSSLWVSGI